MIRNSLAQLQALNATVPGIKSAPLKFPGSLNSAQLPAVITWPGPAVSEPITSRARAVRMVREYSVRVFVEALGQSDTDTPARDGIELLESFLDLYFTNRTLSDGYTQIQSIRDTGITSGAVGAGQLLYAGNSYKGFVLTLSVVEVFSPS